MQVCPEHPCRRRVASAAPCVLCTVSYASPPCCHSDAAGVDQGSKRQVCWCLGSSPGNAPPAGAARPAACRPAAWRGRDRRGGEAAADEGAGEGRQLGAFPSRKPLPPVARLHPAARARRRAGPGAGAAAVQPPVRGPGCGSERQERRRFYSHCKRQVHLLPGPAAAPPQRGGEAHQGGAGAGADAAQGAGK